MREGDAMGIRGKVYLFLLALALLSVAGYLGKGAFSASSAPNAGDPQDAAGANTDEAVPVAVELAARGPIANYLTSTANLRALREVDIAAQLSGVVTGVHVEEGDFVQRGQTLCSLDDRELKIDLALAEQRLAQTRIQLESAKIRQEQTTTQIRNKQVELDRDERALGEGLLAESEVSVKRHEIDNLVHEQRVTESTVRQSEHRIGELESEIRKVQLQLSQTAIAAPFAGRITERTVELGQSINASDTLFKLGSFSSLYADVHLAERDSRFVRPGQQVRVSLGASAPENAVGRVARVSPVVDEETGTVKITVKLEPSSSAFRPGAFVRVEIETDTRADAVLIPKQAVLEEDGLSYVVVLDSEAKANRRTVELGYRSATAVEVLAGVSDGEAVVVAGQGNLKDGDATRTVSD